MKKLILVVCLVSALFSCREKTRCESLWHNYERVVMYEASGEKIPEHTIPEIKESLEKCGCYKNK